MRGTEMVNQKLKEVRRGEWAVINGYAKKGAWKWGGWKVSKGRRKPSVVTRRRRGTGHKKKKTEKSIS